MYAVDLELLLNCEGVSMQGRQESCFFTEAGLCEGGLQRVLDLLGLELQIVGSHQMSAGNQI